jgi:hypothetical protein
VHQTADDESTIDVRTQLAHAASPVVSHRRGEIRKPQASTKLIDGSHIGHRVRIRVFLLA